MPADQNNPYPQLNSPLILGKRIKVADIPLNRDNDYWRDHIGIGAEGVVIDKEEDGLYDVAFPKAPLVQGVKGERFIFLDDGA